MVIITTSKEKVLIAYNVVGLCEGWGIEFLLLAWPLKEAFLLKANILQLNHILQLI